MKPFSDIPPTDPPDFVPDQMSDVLATPEGDGEHLPDQPLNPAFVTTPNARAATSRITLFPFARPLSSRITVLAIS